MQLLFSRRPIFSHVCFANGKSRSSSSGDEIIFSTPPPTFVRFYWKRKAKIFFPQARGRPGRKGNFSRNFPNPQPNKGTYFSSAYKTFIRRAIFTLTKRPPAFNSLKGVREYKTQVKNWASSNKLGISRLAVRPIEPRHI